MTARGARIEGPDAFERGFAVSRETVERLKTYEMLLKTWQRTINLVAPSTLDEVWHRHFADSAQLLDLALLPPSGAGLPVPSDGLSPESGFPDANAAHAVPQAPKNWLDLGSGGGFPGLVLAILLAERDPAARMTLIESDSRKAAFLAEVARKTGVAVEIRPERSEKYATQANSRIRDVITARALAPLPKLLGLVLPYFSPSTRAFFPKGRDAEAELAQARQAFAFEAHLVPSLTDTDARIVVLRNLALKTEG